jgi:hypothetical protein
MRIPTLVLSLALLGAAAPAEAAFDTWTFPGPPLPFRLDDVGYARADRRDAVVEAVRGMALEQLRESGVFRANAAHGVRVELRDVTSTAKVEADGAGTGRAEILYRVTSDAGEVLFNDRIVASVRVGVAESVGLQQSTERAARYRAFVRNLETFALRLWQGRMPSAASGARIDAIALAHGLETPERTADFTNRLRTAVDVLLPQARPPAATPLVLKVESLDFRALPPPGPDRVAATVKLGLVLARPDGAPLWRDATSASAEAPRRRALAAGILPVDAALADATQAALARIAPEVAAAMAEAADLDAIAVAHRLPYSLADIVAGPKLDAPDVLQRLRRWNQTDAPLARAWSAGAPPLTVRLDAAAVRLQKTGPGAGIAEVAATYTVLDADHAALLTRSTTTRSAFSAADASARGATGGEWAVRVGLRDNWAALLDALAALPVR